MRGIKNHSGDNELATLAYFSNSAEAGMVCELLINNGINASLRGANFGALEPLPLTGGFSEIRLEVPLADFERAQEIYQAFFENEEASLKENEDVSNE
jgi:hypothetical protein